MKLDNVVVEMPSTVVPHIPNFMHHLFKLLKLGLVSSFFLFLSGVKVAIKHKQVIHLPWNLVHRRVLLDTEVGGNAIK